MTDPTPALPHPHGTPHHHAGATHPHPGPDPTTDPVVFWEERYAGAAPVWSGRANSVLVDVVADLPPGRALDLGCGEGGDAVWLAGRGWLVTGVDIARTAIARAAQAAVRAGIPEDRTTWVAQDLTSWTAEAAEAAENSDAGRFELVSAFFLQSPVALARAEILRRAGGLLTTGGHLLVVAHAEAPPWARGLAGHDRVFPTPEEEVAALADPAEAWDVVVAEVRDRPATGPDGEQAVLRDSVVLLRRR